MCYILVSGDTENIGEEDIWERIRIIEPECWDEKKEWWNYTPKDKREVINRNIRERSDNRLIKHYVR